jgi:cobalamin synthase
MKKYKPILDIILLIALVVLLMGTIAPKTLVMTTDVQMLILAIALALLAGFVVMVWREHPADEREIQNQFTASRYAYIVGTSILIVGLTVGSLRHNLDPFIPTALIAMVATKLLVQRQQDK